MSNKIVPEIEPRAQMGTSSLKSWRCVVSSSRKPRTPPKVLGKIPTDEDILAVIDGTPRASSVGKLRKVPPPAMPFEMPAAHPAMKMMMILSPRGRDVASIFAV